MTAKEKSSPFDLSAGVPGIQGDMRPKPKFSDRISKRVIFVAICFFGLVVVLFLLSLDQMDNKTTPTVTEDGKKKGASTELEGKVPDELSGKTNEGKEKPAPSLVKQIPAASVVPAPSQIPATAATAEAVKPPPQLTPEEQAELQAKLDRLNRLKQARTSGLTSKPFDGEDAVSASKAAAAPGGPDLSLQRELLKAAAAQGGSPGPVPPTVGDHQDEKLDFIKSATKEERNYHPYVPAPAISQNEVKVGSFIPMTLEQGINSDLPGQVTARVSDAVYDTITGCRLLIPPMSKVVGKYDSKVALGQGRNLVAWSVMVFPDGSELNLAGMQAYDMGGQAGLPADVDNHYLRSFGITFGLSMITAGTQLSVPQSNSNSQQQTPAQTVSMALAQQYGTLGSQILNKYLSVQPTLRNFPGERFTVMVPNTIIFKKVWRNRCAK